MIESCLTETTQKEGVFCAEHSALVLTMKISNFQKFLRQKLKCGEDCGHNTQTTDSTIQAQYYVTYKACQTLFNSFLGEDCQLFRPA